MALYLVNDYIQKKGVVDDFKGFLAADGVLSMASAVIIGIGTIAFISTAVKDVILPVLYYLVFKWVRWVSPDTERGIARLYGNTEFRFLHFFKELVTWVFAILTTFFILEFFVRRVMLRRYKKEDLQHD